ncbi:BofC C-terminal domain-containing protein [Priestia flexa]|uniref:BofC C-terminal domain-containing protein n=1 Tax=Priestia flexa TaxID=86664 RepID=UPI00099D5EA5|nr:BofC C-terminal domain-containing protein [Priestia flexa]AQX53627.1 bypass-of-forespore protein C [Priestia flexa]
MKRTIHQIIIVCTISSFLVSLAGVVEAERPMTIFLERTYVDGVISQEVLNSPYMTKEEVLSAYPMWRVIKASDGEVVLRKAVDDISPMLKENGYVGLSVNGVLSTFEGKPVNSTNIIQSFFQIDVEKLESYQEELLKDGIRVQTKDDYVSLMDFYKMYELNSRPTSSK